MLHMSKTRSSFSAAASWRLILDTVCLQCKQILTAELCRAIVLFTSFTSPWLLFSLLFALTFVSFIPVFLFLYFFPFPLHLCVPFCLITPLFLFPSLTLSFLSSPFLILPALPIPIFLHLSIPVQHF